MKYGPKLHMPLPFPAPEVSHDSCLAAQWGF